jgi:hypothetical protein
MPQRVLNTDPNTLHIILTDERVHVQCNVDRHYVSSVPTPAAYKWSREAVADATPDVYEAFALAKDRADRPVHMTNLLRMVLSACDGTAQESGLPCEEVVVAPDVMGFCIHSTPIFDMHSLIIDCTCVRASLISSFAEVAALRLSSHSSLHVWDMRQWTDLETLPTCLLLKQETSSRKRQREKTI